MNAKSLCARCPDVNTASLCSGTSNHPEKCKTKSNVDRLWLHFANDPSQDPSAQLTDAEKAKAFLEFAIKQNTEFTKIADKLKKKGEGAQLARLSELKAGLTYEGAPVTKQMLEHAFKIVYCQTPGPSAAESASAHVTAEAADVTSAGDHASTTPANVPGGSSSNNSEAAPETTSASSSNPVVVVAGVEVLSTNVKAEASHPRPQPHPQSQPATASASTSTSLVSQFQGSLTIQDHGDDEDVAAGPASNVNNPSRCPRCHLIGHSRMQCKACMNCCRTGHALNDCPYRKNQCGNCESMSHKTEDCARGCTVPKCPYPHERTYFHPHTASGIAPELRASIHGCAPARCTVPAKDANVMRAPQNLDIQKSKVLQQRPEPLHAVYTGDKPDRTLLQANRYTGKSTVITNYVQVKKNPRLVYMYQIVVADVEVAESSDGRTRAIKARGERKRIFKALCEAQGSPLYGREDYATDYETVWTISPLFPLEQPDFVYTMLQYQKQSGRTMSVPSVRISYVALLNFQSGSVDLFGPVTDGRDPHMLTRALNGMMTRSITTPSAQSQIGLFEVGANKFFMEGVAARMTGLAIHRGYFSSIRPGEKSVLLNVNVTHATFLQPMNVADFIYELGEDRNALQDYGDPTSLLTGRAVRICYDRPITDPAVDPNREENRKKQVAGVGVGAHLQQFEASGRMWTVKEWFETHGITLQYPEMVCINVGLRSRGRELWIPCELLELEPGQPFGRQLSSNHMQVMANTALKHPAVNQAAIVQEGLPLLGVGRPAISRVLYEQLQLETGTQLLEIPAQILPPPTLVYQNIRTNALVYKTAQNASWNVSEERFFDPKMIARPPLNIVDFRQRFAPGAGPDDVGLRYLQACVKHGMAVAGFVPDKNRDVRFSRAAVPPFAKGPGYYRRVREIFVDLMEKMERPRFILVILDKADPHFYGSIKRVCETELGIKIICCTGDKLRNPQASLYSNLVLKHNIKQGGTNWTVVDGSSKRRAFEAIERDTIVLGADVIHPGGNTPSVAAIVGSLDKNFAVFAGSIRLQPALKEIITRPNMAAMVKERLVAWSKRNDGRWPSRLLYYRDGVGEDQFCNVNDEEVSQITAAFNELTKASPSKPLSITAIVVGKRHNTRFFAPNDSMTYPDRAGPAASTVDVSRGKSLIRTGARTVEQWPQARNGNVLPGLLVDSVITFPQPNPHHLRDFFLQSHAALKGTAKSAHYIIIRHDAATFGVDVRGLQQLTHAFCYSYARATKGVSYCSPAYYADRLCDRGFRYLRSWLDERPDGRSWSMTPQEQRGGKVGVELFRMRVRDAIAGDLSWSKGRGNPWTEEFDEIAFWL